MAASNPDKHPQPQPPSDADYSERHEIGKLHAAVMREKHEPRDGNEPISLWVAALFGVTLFLGGLYLARYSGGFRADVYNIYEGVSFGPGKAAAGGPGAAAAAVELTLAQQGEKVFRQNCVACHGANGMGQTGVYPPLVGSHWVVEGEQRVTGVLLHGLVGPVEVNGAVYNGVMQAWGKTLTDKQIGAVLSYIRSAWGNTAPEISPEKVAAARALFKDRKEPWTAPDLEKIPAGSTIPVADAPAPPAAPAPAAPPPA